MDWIVRGHRQLGHLRGHEAAALIAAVVLCAAAGGCTILEPSVAWPVPERQAAKVMDRDAQIRAMAKLVKVKNTHEAEAIKQIETQR